MCCQHLWRDHSDQIFTKSRFPSDSTLYLIGFTLSWSCMNACRLYWFLTDVSRLLISGSSGDSTQMRVPQHGGLFSAWYKSLRQNRKKVVRLWMIVSKVVWLRANLVSPWMIRLVLCKISLTIVYLSCFCVVLLEQLLVQLANKNTKVTCWMSSEVKRHIHHSFSQLHVTAS